MPPEREHLRQVALEVIPQLRRIARPLVGAGVGHAGAHVRMLGIQVVADQEALFEIGGRTGVERLRGDRLVAARTVRKTDVDLALLVFGQIKKRTGERQVLRREPRRDAVIAHVKETRRTAGRANLARDGATVGEVAGKTRFQIDDGYRIAPARCLRQGLAHQ